MKTPATPAASGQTAPARRSGDDLRVTLAARDLAAAASDAPATPSIRRAPARPSMAPAWTRACVLAVAGLVAALLVIVAVTLSSTQSRKARPVARQGHPAATVSQASTSLDRRVARPDTQARRRPAPRRSATSLTHAKRSRPSVPAKPVVTPAARPVLPVQTPAPTRISRPKPQPRPHTGGTSCSFPPC
jgi:hypothetical protein